jgi:hypothetical protein
MGLAILTEDVIIARSGICRHSKVDELSLGWDGWRQRLMNRFGTSCNGSSTRLRARRKFRISHRRRGNCHEASLVP